MIPGWEQGSVVIIYPDQLVGILLDFSGLDYTSLLTCPWLETNRSCFPRSKKTLNCIPTWGCSPRDVDGLYPYVYIYIHIWNNYPWISPILHMGWYLLYGFCMDHKPLTQTKLLIFGHPKSAPRNRQGRHSQDPTSCNPGVFRIRIQRSGHWTQKRSHGTPPSRSGDRRRTSRASQGWGSQPGKAQPFDVRCISYTTCLWSSWIFMVYH